MKIASARALPLRLVLRTPLGTAHGTIGGRTGALLELSADDGTRGFGEALPLPGFGLEDALHALEALTRLAGGLAGSDLEAPAELFERIDALATRAPAARAAADVAVHDLVARLAGVPLAQQLAPRAAPRARVPASCLVGADEPAEVESETRAALSAGYRTLKLKLTARDFARDLARLEALRAAAPDVRLRIDANGAWSSAAARERCGALARFEPEYLEQPTPPGDPDELARLRAAAPFPIAADESVTDEAAAERLLAAGAVDLLVVKPAAVGGLRAALRIASAAHRAGVGIAVTSFLDSALGGAAALHLALALPFETPAVGLGRPGLLREDVAPAPRAVGGWLELPQSPGLGVTPGPAWLEGAP